MILNKLKKFLNKDIKSNNYNEIIYDEYIIHINKNDDINNQFKYINNQLNNINKEDEYV
jgi:hypothetical protein